MATIARRQRGVRPATARWLSLPRRVARLSVARLRGVYCALSPLVLGHLRALLQEVEVSSAVARKLTTSREMLLWMTPSEAPKALQASECSELLDPMRASCWISAQREPGKFTHC